MDVISNEGAANIGPRERRKRRVLGVVSLTVAVGVAFVLVAFGAPRWARLVVFFPLWMAGLGLFQARERVCIALAARGVCNMDAGERPVADPALAARLREKASALHRRALLVAAAITLVVLLFPDSMFRTH
jgi:hypothetical protein